MLSTSDFRNGLKIEIDGDPFVIVEFLHVKPGKGGAFVRTKIKNLKTGNLFDRTFRSGEKLDQPDLEEIETQYLYREGDRYCFMDNSTYDQIFLDADQLGESRLYLQENIKVNVLFHQQKPIDISLPIFVELSVIKTDPGLKGDTASGGSKPATLDTGAVINVPLFINEGDILKIDTRVGHYVERIK
jgi:elongation factor P